ncbi:uncharacterized protein LOC108145608 [Drosophila elegans]|uniref:uncharacterized protein LOC108145608 n=1 Tax=Drosophila elegans TaxID=30023 RepID=UPI0007E7FCFD|nr:uncharacterized protein LOC108145608 [Drosophila elegans]
MQSSLLLGVLFVLLTINFVTGLDCPDGYYFSEKIKTCVSVDPTSCENHQIGKCPISTPVNEYCLCKDKYLQIWKCPEGSYFDVNQLACKIGTVECQEDEDYKPFKCPDTTSNRIFCLCIGGKLRQNECLTGYTFSEDQKHCLKN